MTESALLPLVQLGIEISSLCSRNKYSADSTVHAATVDEIRRRAGKRIAAVPEICFHITLPDPAHPKCQTPFEP
jgi:hypothetical protein